MLLAEYVFRRLQELGIDCTFGIPGDFALPLYAVQEQCGLRTVVTTHEPGAGFAADAYARLRGLGVVVTTYGAGGLNLVNPVAGAYAEHSPVLVVSGAPDLATRDPSRLFHHTVKGFRSQQRIYEEITCASAALEELSTARHEIDRVLEAVLSEKRPGYLEIPRDLTRQPLPAESRRARPQPPAAPALDPAAVDEAVADIVARLHMAERPVLYAGVEIRRYGLVSQVVALAERLNLPVVTSPLGKAAFPESHPNFVGVYMGLIGDDAARELAESSDCVIGLGVLFTDVDTGFFTAKLEQRNLILIDDQGVALSRRRYPGAPIGPVVERLLATEELRPRRRAIPSRSAPSEHAPASDGALRIADLLPLLSQLDPARYSFTVDMGDCLFATLDLRADIYMAPAFYASMGFAVPAALGAGIADPTRRPVAVVGDGAFQMTGLELATAVKEGLNPIVIVLNNRRYTMLAALDQPHRYYELAPWDFVGLAKALGAAAERVTTRDGLAKALRRATRSPRATLIEAVIAPDDVSSVMRRIGEAFHKKR